MQPETLRTALQQFPGETLQAISSIVREYVSHENDRIAQAITNNKNPTSAQLVHLATQHGDAIIEPVGKHLQ